MPYVLSILIGLSLGATSVLYAYTYSPEAVLTYESSVAEATTPTSSTPIVVRDYAPVLTSPEEAPQALALTPEAIEETNKITELEAKAEEEIVTAPVIVERAMLNERVDTSVPFFSQFADISSPSWQKVGCGVASLAMLIEYYKPGTVAVDALLTEGINTGAYIDGAGWSHGGLAELANKHGLKGVAHDLAPQSMGDAVNKLEAALKDGPVIASVYYTFDPESPIPHLVVINSIDGDTVSYNDPAEPRGGGTISKDAFVRAWKKRFIEVHT